MAIITVASNPSSLSSEGRAVLCATHLLTTPSQRARRAELVGKNRGLPPLSGKLSKERRGGLLGILGLSEPSHPRYFRLDPAAGTLSYWSPKSLSPKRCFDLTTLEQLDTNRHHQKLFLKFEDSRWLKLMADSVEDFVKWMDMISRYIQPGRVYRTGLVAPNRPCQTLTCENQGSLAVAKHFVALTREKAAAVEKINKGRVRFSCDVEGDDSSASCHGKDAPALTSGQPSWPWHARSD